MPVVNEQIMPATIASPAAAYAHAMLTSQPQRWLHTSGVVPIAPDGTVPDSVHDQAEVVWSNIGAMLTEADMEPVHIVSVTTYVLPGRDLRSVMAARDRFLGGHLAASTLLVVPELAQPAWQLEIAVIAAQ
ncbi:MAG: RidA family protein [Acidimicrobiales bacterium]